MVNFGNMMKQAQQLQKKMAEAQEKLNEIEVEGTSGGGLVKVLSTAKGVVKKISIDENSRIEMLEIASNAYMITNDGVDTDLQLLKCICDFYELSK